MKNKLLLLLLTVVFLFVGICPTFAAVVPASSGFYNIGTASGVTISAYSGQTAVSATSTDVDGDGVADSYYPSSDSLAVTFSGAKSGYEYTISLVKGTSAPTSASTYYYVNQATATSTSVAFSVVPTLPEEATDLILYINSNEPGFSPRTVDLGYGFVAAVGDPPVFDTAPTAVVGNKLARITYSATATDAPITGYQIIVNGEVRETVGSDQTSYAFTNLTNGTSYTISVIAMSAYGNTESPSITIVPGTKPSFAAAPTVTPGDTTATINFSATAEGVEISSYQVKLNGSEVATLDGDATSYTFTGLTNGTSYSATVVAINAIGSTESSAVTFTPVATPTGTSVSGSITSYLDENGQVTVALYAEGSDTAAYIATVTGNSTAYTISNVAAGTYTMKVSKTNHVTREYAVTVASTAVTQDVKIHPTGDITGDGKISIIDATKALLDFKNRSTLTDYTLICGDLNGDGDISSTESTRIKLHFKNKTSLWQ